MYYAKQPKIFNVGKWRKRKTHLTFYWGIICSTFEEKNIVKTYCEDAGSQLGPDAFPESLREALAGSAVSAGKVELLESGDLIYHN